ncbi:ABC transporter substrate-binding protein [Arenibaculum pallidiluteum]|uniref:ABC transporter substrate-binding protein n=1 Tax=Arenibaculum pallidiluteum TaxID=2812559 RepID=UPI001A9723E5|nr:ABC transporter substrate-binding protein [Arenibaculum pallidiluteum]
MKSWSAAFVGGLMAATALASSGALGATPRDTVVMAKQIDDIISLDPGESFEFSGSEAVGNIYDKLLTFDLANVSDIRGQLAETWSVSDDGTTYSFKIRKGIKFHSGNPVTAKDAAWSFQRAVIMDKQPAFILSQFGFTKDNVKERIQAVDDDTLVIRTDKAYAPTFFFYCLTASVASVVDSKLAMQHEKNGDLANEWLRTNSAASGAYKLRRWEPKESYTLEANEAYWDGAPRNRRVVVRNVGEAASQRLLLEKGDVDFARNLEKDQIVGISGNKDLKTTQGVKGSLFYISLNQKNEQLRKPEVIEAIKYLIDYKGIEENLLKGRYQVHQAFLPKGFMGASEAAPYKLDIARAKDLLAKAGLGNGFQVTMDVRNISPYTDVAQAIQGSFAQAGIRLELIPGDGKQTLTKYRARNHDIYIGEWGPDYQDPHTNAQTFAMNPDNSDEGKTKTLAWRNAWDIPEMTKATEAAVVERDAGKRAQIYKDLQAQHQKVSPFAIMFQQIEVAAHRANVDGLVIGPSFDNNYYKNIVKK